MGPRPPSPFGPWHSAQCTEKSFSPAARSARLFGSLTFVSVTAAMDATMHTRHNNANFISDHLIVSEGRLPDFFIGAAQQSTHIRDAVGVRDAVIRIVDDARVVIRDERGG